MRVRYLIPLCVVPLAACASSGAAPGALAPPPAVEIKANDVALLPITVAAAGRIRFIVPAQRVAFGVYISSRTVDPATDSIVHLYSFTRGPVQAKCVMMTTTVTSSNHMVAPNAPPVNCTMDQADAYVTFTNVRSRNDSAFVGGQQLHIVGISAQTDNFCITLVRSGGAWVPTAHIGTSRPDQCPK